VKPKLVQAASSFAAALITRDHRCKLLKNGAAPRAALPDAFGTVTLATDAFESKVPSN
jgi:hypothetical protein